MTSLECRPGNGRSKTDLSVFEAARAVERKAPRGNQRPLPLEQRRVAKDDVVAGLDGDRVAARASHDERMRGMRADAVGADRRRNRRVRRRDDRA